MTPQERQREVVRKGLGFGAFVIGLQWVQSFTAPRGTVEFVPIDFSLHGRDVAAILMTGMLAWWAWSFGDDLRPDTIRRVRWWIGIQAAFFVLTAVIVRFPIGGNPWLWRSMSLVLCAGLWAPIYYLMGDDNFPPERRKPSTAHP